MRSLRTRFPESQIHFLVASEYAEAARLLPEIDKVIEFNRKDGWRGLLRLRHLLSRKYDVIIDLQNSLRSAFLRVFCFPLMWTKATRYRFRRWVLIRFKRNLYGEVKPVPLRYIEAMESLGVVDDGIGMKLKIPESELSEHRRPLAVLCPGARHETKRWPLANWIHLADSLRLNGYNLIVCGSKSEEQDCRRIPGSDEVMIDKPLVDVAKAMRAATVVICHDSGLMHLAVGVDARLVAIFGPTVKEFGFFPFRAHSIEMQQDLTCRPCTAFGGNRCPLGHHNCMNQTTPEQVRSAVESVLQGDLS